MSTITEAAECGMFLYEGFRDYMERYPHAIADGAVEAAQALAQVAEYVVGQTNAWILDHGIRPEDYNGVLQYEVWNTLGWRIAELSDSRASHSAGWLYDKPRWGILLEDLHPLLADFFREEKRAV